MNNTPKIGLPPIAPRDARVFVLGSLPGDATGAQLRAFLTDLKAGRVSKPGADTDEAPF